MISLRMIEHFSWSSMNSYDNDIHSFYTRYVLWEEPVFCENVKKAMEFWKEYEIWLSKWLYEGWHTQTGCELIIWWYKLFGLFDFYREEPRKQVVECKTKSWWWTKEEIRKSWQFRFYNHWCWKNWYEFILHEFNKKENIYNELDIKRKDNNFEEDFINKAKQIERFLKQFNIEVRKYDI